jgi:hypothetical protein
MNVRTLIAVIALLVFAAGLLWFFSARNNPKAEAMYAYSCANGVSFSISPAADASWVAIFPDENAGFAEQTLAYVDNLGGKRYSGSDIGLAGKGDNIELVLNSASTSCTQTADAGEKWNWDTVQVGDIPQNIALLTTHSLAGLWRSTNDPKFTRAFKADGTFIDAYDGAETTHGLWFAFTDENAPAVPFPLKEHAVYLQLADSSGEVYYFQIISMALTNLSMIYMDRGGVLTFTLVQ